MARRTVKAPATKTPPLDVAAAHRLLARANRQHAEAIAAVNEQIMFRAGAAWRAHYEAGLSWQTIADALEIARPTAINLAQRYERAIAENRAMALAGSRNIDDDRAPPKHQ